MTGNPGGSGGRRRLPMMSSLSGVARLTAATLIGATIAVGGGLAFASDGNALHACANKTTGALRLVEETGGCHVSETSVEWNIQGPPGPQGEAATPLFVSVRSGHLGDPTPVVFGSSGVVSVERTQPGFYVVEFDQDVATCSAVASISSFNGGFPGHRIISTVHWPHEDEMRDSIGIRTQRFLTFPDDFIDEDASFSLTVTC